MSETCEHAYAYTCAFCSEMRCMKCNRPCSTENIKTAVRWCPRHHEAGIRGLLQGEVRCTGCGEAILGGDDMTSYRHSPSPGVWRDEVRHARCDRSGGSDEPLVWLVKV